MSNEKINLPKGKTGTVNVEKLIVDNGVNIRFQSGQNVHGMEIRNGSYDIETMMTDIRQYGGIHTPLVVSKRANGDMVVLQGNRRTLAGQAIMADPETPKDLYAALTKTQALVYEDLSPEQEVFLVNDQNQKKFKKSEFIQFMWRLHDQGWSYERLVSTYWAQCAEFTGADESLRKEIEALKTDKERTVRLKAFFKTSIDNMLLAANTLGETVKRIYLSWFMVRDALITQEQQGNDVFKITKPERLKSLRTIQDAEKHLWSPDTGSPEFNAKIEQFILEDKGDPDSKPLKRPSVQSLKDMHFKLRSKVGKKAISFAQGEDVPYLVTEDMEMARRELVIETLAAKVNEIKDPAVGDLIRKIVFGKDIPDLELTLAKFC